MKRIGVKIPEDRMKLLCVFEAVRQGFQYFPEVLLFDALIDKYDSDLVELVRVSSLFQRTIVLSQKPEILDESAYSFIFDVSPTEENSKKYGEEEKQRKIEESARVVGNTEAVENAPAMPYSMLMTICEDFHRELSNLRGSWRTPVDLVNTVPYIQVNKNTKEHIRYLLRKELLWNSKPVKDYAYVVIESPKEEEEAWSEIADSLEFVSLILVNGEVISSGVHLTDIEKAALIANQNCLAYIGSSWLKYVSWFYKKNLIVDVSEDGDVWNKTRGTNSVMWDKSNKDLEELKKVLNRMLESALYYRER